MTAIRLWCPTCTRPIATTEALIRHLADEHSTDRDTAWALIDEVSTRARRIYLGDSAGARFRDLTLDTFPAEDACGRRALDAVHEWLAAVDLLEGGRSLFVWGPPGSGKSGLAHGIGLELAAEGLVVWVNVRQLLVDAKAGMNAGSGFDITRSLPFEELDAVVVDDLGAERPTPFAVDVLGYLVERLHADRRPIITTSNYSPSQLAALLGHANPVAGERIVSRLLDGALKIHLDRSDLRLRRSAA